MSYLIAETREDGTPRAFLCSAASHGGTFAPWTGEASKADRFTEAEAIRGADEWNDYAATHSVPRWFRAIPEGEAAQ